MAHGKDIPVRDARDRLIDLLGFGETYPLRDLAILDEQLTVPFNTRAKIPLDPSQLEVLYQLYDREDQPVKPSPDAAKGIEAQGTGNMLLIESPLIQDDVTYKVRAVKNRTHRAAYLHETATIKVGLDVTLSAQILTGDQLDPSIEIVKDTDPKIIDYGKPVEVKLKLSQEGVDYRLVYLDGSTEVVLTETDVRGNFSDITLVSRAIYEDTDLRIRAVKTFDPSEGRKTQTALLDIVLPLKVRANPALKVLIEPTHVTAYNEERTLRIDNTQKSTEYQLWIQKIADTNFVHGTPPDSEIITVLMDNDQKVQVHDPSDSFFKSLASGFQETGGSKKGTNGVLRFTLKGLTEDCVLIVKASKTHAASNPVSSTVQLKQAAVVLVHPNPEPSLHFKVYVSPTEVIGPVEVSDGQAGVYYYLRPKADGTDLGLPAYFHKKDEWNALFNKGLGQLKVGIDFAVPRDFPKAQSDASIEAAKTFPANPLVDIQKVPLDSNLSLLAIKAQTGVKQLLSKTAKIPSLPDISFENTEIAAGKAAKVVITESRVGERYQLFLDGNAVRQARNGNGQTLTINTDPISTETIFEMRVTQPGASDSFEVERVLLMKVDVQPESS